MSDVQLGAALRAVREQRGLSLREVARRVGVSPSFVSQVETGKANPSVGTLYSLVAVLGTSLDDLMDGRSVVEEGRSPVSKPPKESGTASRVLEDGAHTVVEEGALAPVSKPPGGHTVVEVRGAPATSLETTAAPIEQPLQRATDRKRLEMTGVIWERLTHDHDPYVDFLQVEYAPGSESCAPDELMRHGGREYGHVLTGHLDIQIGFETYSVGPGDSIHFDSTTPHRLSNPYAEPCTAIWFVIARSADDRPSGYA